MGLEKYIKKIGEKVGQHFVRAVYAPSDVLPFRTYGKTVKAYQCQNGTVNVNMDSQRYWVFAESLQCPECGLVGEAMILNSQNLDDQQAHFNLYGMDNGEMILFTKDHIHAKSNGGKDALDNYVTMCSKCNWIRGNGKHKGLILRRMIRDWQIDL